MYREIISSLMQQFNNESAMYDQELIQFNLVRGEEFENFLKFVD